MGDIGDIVFGSSDEGGYKGSAPTLTPEQKDFFDKLIGTVQPQLGQGVSAYPGQIAPGESPIQGSTFDLVDRMLSGGSGTEAINRIMGGSQDIPTHDIGPFDPTSTQASWEKMIQPAFNQWEDKILPGVKEAFIGRNAGRSGASNRAIAESGENLATNMGSMLGDMLFMGEQAHLGRQFSGTEADIGRAFSGGQNDLMRMLNIPGMETQPIRTGLLAGDVERGIEGEQLGEGYQKWGYEQPYNNPWLQMINSILGTNAVEPIIQGPSSQSGLLQDVVVPLLSAAISKGG